MKNSERLGESRLNNFGSKMTIISYKNYENIVIQFEDGFIKKSNYGNFLKGTIRNPYERTVHGVGYLGGDKYKTKINGIKTKNYIVWQSMLERCYSQAYRKKDKSYIGCIVCDEWHNFQIFSKWFYENYYEIENEETNLDKDILVKGNKVYSPETCIFTPKNINTLFCKSLKNRGQYAIGVSYKKDNKKFEVQCNQGNKKIKYLGLYDSELQAFNAYKTEKERVVKKIAEEYKSKIPEKLYLALINYQVEITD